MFLQHEKEQSTSHTYGFGNMTEKDLAALRVGDVIKGCPVMKVWLAQRDQQKPSLVQGKEQIMDQLSHFSGSPHEVRFVSRAAEGLVCQLMVLEVSPQERKIQVTTQLPDFPQATAEQVWNVKNPVEIELDFNEVKGVLGKIRSVFVR